jgi:hypothetical protein
MTYHYRFALATTLFAMTNQVTNSSFNGIKLSASKIKQYVFTGNVAYSHIFFFVAFGIVELIFFKFKQKKWKQLQKLVTSKMKIIY